LTIAFDMDEPGQRAAHAVCDILPTARIAELPAKDANECLMQGLTDELIKSVIR
jgi:twinkle protein